MKFINLERNEVKWASKASKSTERRPKEKKSSKSKKVEGGLGGTTGDPKTNLLKSVAFNKRLKESKGP